MPKRAVRFLTLSVLATSLLAVPMVTPVSAATAHHKHVKKRTTVVTHQTTKDPGANPFASKYEDDFDRKNAGAGGGY